MCNNPIGPDVSNQSEDATKQRRTDDESPTVELEGFGENMSEHQTSGYIDIDRHKEVFENLRKNDDYIPRIHKVGDVWKVSQTNLDETGMSSEDIESINMATSMLLQVRSEPEVVPTTTLEEALNLENDATDSDSSMVEGSTCSNSRGTLDLLSIQEDSNNSVIQSDPGAKQIDETVKVQD